jgi:hypothetical protein
VVQCMQMVRGAGCAATVMLICWRSCARPVLVHICNFLQVLDSCVVLCTQTTEETRAGMSIAFTPSYPAGTLPCLPSSRTLFSSS